MNTRSKRTRPSLTEAVEEAERTDPEVANAKEALDRTVDRILGRGPALSYSEIAAIYGPDGDEMEEGDSTS